MPRGRRVLANPWPGKREELAERALEAYKLRKAGLSYRAIAEHLGIDVRAVHTACMKRLKEVNEQSGELAIEMRTLEGERLNDMQTALWPLALQGDIPSILAILKIMDKRSDLFGLNLPVMQDITINGQLVGGITEADREAILALATPIFKGLVIPEGSIDAEIISTDGSG